MQQFLKQVSAIVIGNIIALTLILAIGTHFFFRGSDKAPSFSDKIVLHVDLRGEVVERMPSPLSKLLKGNREEKLALIALKEAFQRGQEDPRVHGLYLEANDLKAGWAQLEEMREALLAF